MTFNNQLGGKGTLDLTKYYNRVLRNGYRTFELAGTMQFEETAEYDKFRTSQTQAMTINIKGAEVASGYNVSLKLEYPKVRHKEFPINIGGPTALEVSFSSESRYDASSAFACRATLVNSMAGSY
jgi:hypothetical protein